MGIPNTVWFWSLLIFLIPSIICLLFVLYHLLFDRTLRHGLNNHVIIIILIIDLITEVTVYPWMLYFYNHDGVWKRSFIFCEIWSFIDFATYFTHTILFSWATMERHILIFHDRWVSTKKKRFFVHYLPPTALLLYCLLYYTIVNFFPPCQNIIIDSYTDCSFQCMYNIYTFQMYDIIVQQMVPFFVILLFSIALFLRVLWQKHRVRQPVQWRKHRKMTIQLLSISLLYVVLFIPEVVGVFVGFFSVSAETYTEFSDYAGFFTYFVPPLFPFVCALSLPELRTKLNNILHLRGQARRVAPEAFAMRRIVNRQIPNQ